MRATDGRTTPGSGESEVIRLLVNFNKFGFVGFGHEFRLFCASRYTCRKRKGSFQVFLPGLNYWKKKSGLGESTDDSKKFSRNPRIRGKIFQENAVASKMPVKPHFFQ